MHYRRRYLPILTGSLLLSFSALCAPSSSRNSSSAPTTHDFGSQLHSDTTVVRINYRDQSARSEAFYDSLETRHYKNPLIRLLVRSLIRNRDASDEGIPLISLKTNRNYFERFRGKRICGIRISHADIFAPHDTLQQKNWFERSIDDIHIKTDIRQLTQNLLFHVGDTINPHLMGINEGILRSLPYLATAYFVVFPDPQHPDGVVIQIFVRDNWSIGGEIRWGDRREIALLDRNFLGKTNELRLSYTCDDAWKNFGIAGDYTIRNLLGSFTDLTLKLGVGPGQNIASIDAQRPFILPSDHGWGFSAGRTYFLESQYLTDTSYYVDRFDANIWYGKSWCLNWTDGTNIYLSGSLGKERYNVRPAIDTTYNPYYHNTQEVLFSIGFARKNFFQGNMIYGYGRTEDIPYGFRTELILGRQWDELLGPRNYIGGRFFWGNLIGGSYVELGITGGSFLRDHAFEQATIIGTIKYFTPLLRVGSSYIRQFGAFSAAMGFNRLEGERESLRYQSWRNIRGLQSTGWLQGKNRLIMTGETVLFTPIFLYHFRFAFFTFGDLGWLGDNNNLFANRFTGALGAGVRIKNERLIFNNIQIRLGVAFNRPPGVGYTYFSVSNEQVFSDFEFTPGRPQKIDYY